MRQECGAGFSLHGTSVPLERLTGTSGRRAEATPQAEARPTLHILRASIIALTLASVSGFAGDPLLNRVDVKKALAYIEANHAKTLQSQVTIAEIPAPTFHEAERAKYLVSEFRRLGLANVG